MSYKRNFKIGLRSAGSFGTNYYIYTYIGGEEGYGMLNNWKLFNSVLKEKNNPDIQFKQQMFEKKSHATVTLSAFSKAIKLSMEKQKLPHFLI